MPANVATIVWVHTHPGDSPQPSGVDEDTFARVFGHTNWSVMFILARGGAVYARLAQRSGPHVSVEIPVEVDFSANFPAADQDAWEAEYDACVQPMEFQRGNRPKTKREKLIGDENPVYAATEAVCEFTGAPCRESACGWCAACHGIEEENYR